MTPGPAGGPTRIMAEINMVPFIDIVLVLLIIFMVLTPALVRSQLKVNLPAAGAAEHLRTADKTVEIEIDATGAISIAGRRVLPDAVAAGLKAAVTDPEHQPVVIHADRAVPFQAVVTVMDAAKKLGVASLGVGVKAGAAGSANAEARH